PLHAAGCEMERGRRADHAATDDHDVRGRCHGWPPMLASSKTYEVGSERKARLQDGAQKEIVLPWYSTVNRAVVGSASIRDTGSGGSGPPAASGLSTSRR